MKKFSMFVIMFLTVCVCCLFAACSNKEPVKVDENTVIIIANDSSFDFDGKSLKDYMYYLQKSQKLTYSISDGMVTAINGKSNTTNSYWMLYTSDSDNANEEWGTIEHEDTIYGSATLGATALTVKENCIYIWAYQTF